jgi:hypothetical protein
MGALVWEWLCGSRSMSGSRYLTLRFGSQVSVQVCSSASAQRRKGFDFESRVPSPGGNLLRKFDPAHRVPKVLEDESFYATDQVV